MQLCVGTSGFSYDGWKGSFYPVGLPARERLQFYGEQLSTVEINNTFYRMPRREVVEGWAAQVPDSFRFSIKASRRISHIKRLGQVDEEAAYLFGQLESLGPKLGVVLVQTPPKLAANLERLERFLDLVPEGVRIAFEPRHPSWRGDDAVELLRSRHCALVHADAQSADAADDEAEAVTPELIATAPFGYLRLRREGYDEAALRDWALRIRAQGWEQAFVFFKHEDEGAAPKLAARFQAIFESTGVAPARRTRDRKSQAG